MWCEDMTISYDLGWEHGSQLGHTHDESTIEEFYIIVDQHNKPVSWYSDEYQYWYDLQLSNINGVEIFEDNNEGYNGAIELAEFLTKCETQIEGEVTLPLKVVKIETHREIIDK